MSKESLIFILGFLVLLTPFLGIPSDWKEIVLIVIGGALMIIGYSLRRAAFFRLTDTGSGERRGDAFVESVSYDASESTSELNS